MSATIIELLVNPFCMAERDVDAVEKLCRDLGVALMVYNIWEIDDPDLIKLSCHIAALIKELRSGERPGSVYSNLFVNGERLPLNKWPHHMDAAKEAITRTLSG